MSVKNADLRHLGIMGKLQKPSASALKLYTITRPAGQIACVDAAETHISTLKNVKRTASKTASKKVQVEFEDSSDEVHGCFERVPALWCPDRKAKTVRFRPSPPNLTSWNCRVWLTSTDECQRKCQQDL